MAKILSVSLQSIPEIIIIDDNKNDFTVIVEIKFHKIDISLEMEYCLHLFTYDINGAVDAPLIVANWDESKVLPISSDREDEFLGVETKKIKAKRDKETISVPMSLNLGKHTQKSSHFSKKLEVFATLTPAIGRASKWSEPFVSKILY